MVIEEQKMGFHNIGRTVKSVLLKAQAESRLITGLSESINCLSKIPDGSLFCLLAQPQIGDSATHMHEVLLEAFCYENDIYVVKVDSADKLSRILGIKTIAPCCLIQKSFIEPNGNEHINNVENILVDHCEEYWDSPQQPVIKLPTM